MFGNVVNVHDFRSALERFAKVPGVLKHLLLPKQEIVRRNWNEYEIEPLNRMLEARFNRLISGDPDVARYEYACRKYLGDRRVRAVSLGCGSGEHEILWARQGAFDRLDACDLSPGRIETARQNARDAGLAEILEFACADILNLPYAMNAYDVVILESSLHHFSPLSRVMESIRNLLKPGGLIFMTDFVGPTKFQWLPRQIQVVNALMDLLPDRFLIEKDGRRIEKLFKPSYLRMHLVDPSEAIESGNILPMLRKHFQELELKNAGGAILLHLFPRLSHNFPESDPVAQAWLRHLIEVEDLLLHETDEIGWWYAFGVYRKPG